MLTLPSADKALAGFNRTFMELKCVFSNNFQVFKILFQSYLYGIEIERVLSSQNGGDSFNRTFMELKYRMAHSLASGCGFQSYLYGIEMNFSQHQKTKPLVSIVPLWN